MSFDPMMYNTFMQAAHSVLEQNIQQVGQQFARGFMDEFTFNPNNSQSVNNAQRFFNHVATETHRQNGQMVIRDRMQLFQIVQDFVKYVFNAWVEKQRQQQQQMGGGFNSFGMTSNGFSNGGSMFNQGQGGGFGQQARPQAGGHLADDTPSTPAANTSATNPAPMAATPITSSAAIVITPSVNYVANPLDDIPDTGIEFSVNETNSTWNGDKPRDNRIVLGGRDEIKTRDSRFTIHAGRAYHQEILNDPMQVARDFFAIVPDSVLGSVFFYTTFYNHLDIINVPTQVFIEIRDKCIAAVQSDPEALLHKQLIDSLKSMQYGAHQALTAYLVQHINRALYLACRLSTKPDTQIAIDTFDDLDELLSSNFRHSITSHPDGRFRLSTIVGNAIWNALVKNTSVMFEDETNIPTHAIQSSPVFPYSIEGVYPNKFSIPTSADADAPVFMEKMKEKELNYRTYLLSRRKVVVTNMMGKKVLPEIRAVPKLINTPLAGIFHSAMCMLPFGDPSQTRFSNNDIVQPYVSEDYPTDQLENYLSDQRAFTGKLIEKHHRMHPIKLPLDQTIFAVQYGVKASDYLTAIDVFSTIDDHRNQNGLIAAHRSVPNLTITG